MAMDNASSSPPPPRRLDPRWKILYLVAVTSGALAIPSWLRPYAVPALLLLQVALLLPLAVTIRDLMRMTNRLKGLFLFLILCYLLLPAAEGDRVFELPLGVFEWYLYLNVTGLGVAVIMCGQILTVILASAVVRLSGSESDLVEGLQKLLCPRLLVYSIDNTLALLGGLDRRGQGGGGGRGGGGGGGGGGRGKGERRGVSLPVQGAPLETPAERGPGFWSIVRRLLQGDVGLV